MIDIKSQISEITATVVVGKFGAVDYLTTDYGSDDACIQAAIDYVSGLGKGTIVVREGDYIPAAKIDLASNVDMLSIGAKLTLPNSATHAMFDGSNKSNVEIKGFQFSGNATNSASGRGLYFGGGNKILIENNYFTDFGGDCIFGNSILDSTIQNNRFYDFGYYGIHLYADATRVNILNNHLRLCTFHEPIEVYGDTGNIASQIIVANNNIENANGANCAIHFKVNIQYSQIVNNIIKGSQYHGILLTDADYNIVNNNTLTNVSLAGSGGYNGVTIAGSSNHNDVSHNNVYQEYPAEVTVRYKHAVGEFDTADYNKISNNMCFGQLVPAGTQISKVGDNTTITLNNGHNPVGNFTAPSVPATTVNYTNNYGYPCQVQVYGGTVTEIDIDDIATGLTAGIFIIPPRGIINITYSAAPSWRWWGL